MRSIIEKIYNLRCDERKIDLETSENEKREFEGFEDLRKTLSGDHLTKFISYTDILDELYRNENEQAFRDGFILGALLMTEIFNKKN